MRQATITKLLELVQRNYQEIAGQFDQTRQKEIWPEIKILAANLADGASLLDLGCGNGRLIEALRDKKIEYLGLDNSPELIKLAQNNYPAYKFLVGDILKLADVWPALIIKSGTPDKQIKFDYIFCLAVLQHIPSAKLRLQALRAMREALNPGGQLIISVWNLWSPVWRAKRYRTIIFKNYLLKIIGRQDLDFGDLIFPWKNTRGEIVSERYYHAFTKGELLALALKAGFKKIELKKDQYNYWLTIG